MLKWFKPGKASHTGTTLRPQRCWIRLFWRRNSALSSPPHTLASTPWRDGGGIQAGLALQGTEVKALRAGEGSIGESYAEVRDGQGGWLVSIFGQPARMKIMKKILAALPAGEPPAPGCVGLLYNNLPLWGRDHLVYEVAGHKYRVGAQSFFQGNLAATEDAVATVRAWLDEVATGDLFCDLFCGVGLFSLALADRFVQVIAVEVDRNACRDAANNFARAEAAGRRVALHEGPVTRILARDDLAAPEAWASATVLVDPPRAGLGRNGVKALLARRPRHLVYMSCDPATLARDTAGFAEGGYALRKLKVMDFFPQTAHIECLALLERTDP